MCGIHMVGKAEIVCTDTHSIIMAVGVSPAMFLTTFGKGLSH